MSFFAMPLLCFDNCPEKRDESNPDTIGIGWLKFIPFFGTLQSSLLKGHKAKKDIPLFPAKKDIPMLIHQIPGNFKELLCYVTFKIPFAVESIVDIKPCYLLIQPLLHPV